MFLFPARTKKMTDSPPDDLVQSLNDMSLVTGCAKRQVMTSLTLLVFGVKSFFRYRFRTCRSVKIPTGMALSVRITPHVLLHHHLQYFIIVLEADADVS
jgi:hypothetical protein